MRERVFHERGRRLRRVPVATMVGVRTVGNLDNTAPRRSLESALSDDFASLDITSNETVHP